MIVEPLGSADALTGLITSPTAVLMVGLGSVEGTDGIPALRDRILCVALLVDSWPRWRAPLATEAFTCSL